MSIKRFLFLSICAALALLIAFLLTQKNRNLPKTSQTQNLLLTGSGPKYLPTLLYINTSNFQINDLLKNIDPPKFSLIHEARTLLVNDNYKIALATGNRGEMAILAASDHLLTNPKVEYEDVFDGERVRAIDTGDIKGDGNTEVVVGTRPSGIVKYYQYSEGKWKGAIIDKVGATIHDLLIFDSDGDGKKEIFVTTSTTFEAESFHLQAEIPIIIRYKFNGNGWDKDVVWKADTPINDPNELHARYIFGGDFDGDGKPELVSGLIGDWPNVGVVSLLMLKWNGSGYIKNMQTVNEDMKLANDVISAGDVYNNGRDDIVLPTLTSDALVLFKWQGNNWERDILINNPAGPNNKIGALSILNSGQPGFKKIFYVTTGSSATSFDGTRGFYLLGYNASTNSWNSTLVNGQKFPVGYGFLGLFPISAWSN